MRRIAFLFLVIPFLSFSQTTQPDAAKIKLKLKKLNVLASVLYVAAHPDDENTRIITYMANDQLAQTAYLSMTRGDGGQNLIGAEIRDLLGLIRTQELITARNIDGGQQFFTRANDFGFSKSADETFQIWGKDEILHDVVKVYRMFKPDVIITRFPPDERAGHGHHTASAILAQEAFDAALNTAQYPQLAKEYGTWQPKRLYTNTGRWWNSTINESTPGVVTIDVGGYSFLLGKSYSEIAAISRSQHKSQGFGSRGTRGAQPEYLEYIKGEHADKNVFEEINTTWSRVKGGDKIQPLVSQILQSYNEENPVAILPSLITLRKEISSLESSIWKDRKLQEVESIIQDCLGLFIEPTTNQYWVAPGQSVVASVELVNRSSTGINITHISAPAIAFDSTCNVLLKDNKVVTIKTKKQIDQQIPYSDPYWLKQPHSTGLFTVSDEKLITRPENEPVINFQFTFSILGENIQYIKPLVYKWTDPVKGELTRPFEVVPPIFVNLADRVIIFKDIKPKEVSVLLKSSSEKTLSGTLKLDLPAGWQSEPASIPFSLSRMGEEVTKVFLVTPTAQEMTASLNAVAEIDGKKFDQAIQLISYDHIPIQTLLPKAQAKVVKLDLKNEGGVIGYIKGAGDDVPTALRNLGYEVWEMKNEEVTAQNLKRVDAVVLGIRAINTNDRIRFMMPDLLEYVKNGGTMITQYNTNFELEAESFSPYPLTLSRDRVTEEDAEVTILKPDHRAMNYPNKISVKDFDGWVQERGLYFPNKWDEHFEPILSMHDKGETAKEGSLLVAQYGTGYYVYTGLSFFRELPEGVAGAYKLFSNLVSLSKVKKVENTKLKKK